MIPTLPKEGTLYRLLLKGSDADWLLSEWWEASGRCDLRVRRAKTKGCLVIETADVVFASHVVKMMPGVKVDIKEPV